MICACGIDKDGHRQLVSVRLGARESKEDWVELGRDLMARADPLGGVVAGDLYERGHRRRSPTAVMMPATATGAG